MKTIDPLVYIDNDGTVTFPNEIEVLGSVDSGAYLLTSPHLPGEVRVSPDTVANGVNIFDAVTEMLAKRTRR